MSFDFYRGGIFEVSRRFLGMAKVSGIRTLVNFRG